MSTYLAYWYTPGGSRLRINESQSQVSRLETGSMKPCIFCGSTDGLADDEHVIPKWARRAFDIQGWVTIHASDDPDTPRKQVGRLRHLNVVLKDLLCRRCNNEWLADLERAVAPVLMPMALAEKPARLTPQTQAFIALWAVKTGLLLEYAIRQGYPGRRRSADTWQRHRNSPGSMPAGNRLPAPWCGWVPGTASGRRQ
jgi:hypothetical protein